MSEILSQDEIDALLAAYESAAPTGSTGAVSDGQNKQVRLYDFSRPDRVSKDHLRALGLINTNFASSLSTVLSGLYQSPVRIEFIGVDQILYSEYRISIPSRTLFVEVSMAPLDADFIIEVNPGIIGAWVDCLCGAVSISLDEPSEFSAIDLAVSQKMFDTLLQVYADSWAGLVDLKPETRRMVDSNTFEDILLPSETVLVCTFEVHYGEQTGMMTICIPSAGIEALQKILSSDFNTRILNRRDDASYEEDLKSAVSAVSLPARVVIGRTKISFSDAMNLEIGDIIKTTTKYDSPIELWISNNPMFYCRPGMVGSNLAVVISGPMPDDRKGK